MAAIGLLSVSVVLAQPASDPSSPAPEKAREAYLGKLVAERAEIANGTMTLTGLADGIVVFAGRPFHTVANEPMSDFLALWDERRGSFAEDPPNAAVIGLVDSKQVAIVVTLTNPILVDEKLTFDIALVDGAAVPDLSKVVLIIDSWE